MKLQKSKVSTRFSDSDISDEITATYCHVSGYFVALYEAKRLTIHAKNPQYVK